IIGAGNHVKDRLLPAILALKEVHLRAICTGTGAQGKALAEKTKAVYCTSDYREVLHDASVDIVVIGTRHDTHGTLVAEALESGKHVFVEKPLCLTEEELERIISAYEKGSKEGLHLMVGFNRRFSVHAEKAKSFFQDRKNPLVMAFRVNAGPQPPDHWTQDPQVGGGRIMGEACHFVDYMQAVCGALPSSVHARRIAHHNSGVMDDQSLLSVAFRDGSIGVVVYAAGGDTAMAKERFEGFGDGKSLAMDDFLVSELYAHGNRTIFKSGKQDKGFRSEMIQFVTGIARGEGPVMRFDEIESVTRTCMLAVQSLRTGQVYDVPGLA
ncbi:MAG TPA: Gfo/Idh/MocA family oxidoreductase, partial [Nitrospirales bacterium]|nr:Gfo/Idh/MocA family oxidoreductase [Nitrospirales bacterium]